MKPQLQEIANLLEGCKGCETPSKSRLECSCGCGCSDEKPKDSKDKKKLDEKPKKEEFEGADRVLAAVTESRRRIGLRQWRRFRKVASVRKGSGKKLSSPWRAKLAVRKGAAHNRHR